MMVAMASRRRRPGRGSAVASGLLGDLVEIFQPSRRHVEAELERRRLDVQHPGTGAAPVDVDLEAGVAYLPSPVRAPTTPPPGTPDS